MTETQKYYLCNCGQSLSKEENEELLLIMNVIFEKSFKQVFHDELMGKKNILCSYKNPMKFHFLYNLAEVTFRTKKNLDRQVEEGIISSYELSDWIDEDKMKCYFDTFIKDGVNITEYLSFISGGELGEFDSNSIFS